MMFDIASLSVAAWGLIMGMLSFLVWLIKKYINNTEAKINRSEANVNELTKSFNASILILNKSINELSSILVETRSDLVNRNEGCKERHTLITQTLKMHDNIIDEQSLKINTAEIEIKTLKEKLK